MSEISIQEAAQRLSVEDRTVRNWVHRVGIPTTPDQADGRRRLITDDDLKFLAQRFRRPLAPDPSPAYNAGSATSASSPVAPDVPPVSQSREDTPPNYTNPATDEELRKVLQSLLQLQAQLQSEISSVRAKVDLLVETTVKPNATAEREISSDDVSAETHPLKSTNELVGAGAEG